MQDKCLPFARQLLFYFIDFFPKCTYCTDSLVFLRIVIKQQTLATSASWLPQHGSVDHDILMNNSRNEAVGTLFYSIKVVNVCFLCVCFLQKGELTKALTFALTFAALFQWQWKVDNYCTYGKRDTIPKSQNKKCNYFFKQYLLDQCNYLIEIPFKNTIS